MKKVLFCIAMIFSTLAFANKVQASSFNVNIIGNKTFENEITLELQVNNLVEFSDVCNGLCGLVFDLNYDTSKIELTSINALQGFDLTQGKTIVLYKSTGVPSGTKILTMKFKNKSLKKNENTTISLSNIVGSDGDKDINTNNISKTIKLIEKKIEDNTSNNNNSNSNTSSNNSANKPNSNITNDTQDNPKSGNSYLNSINLSAGEIDFKKDVLTYDVVVDYNTTNINIDAQSEDENALINGIGNYSLIIGNNVIEITVKAEDNTERTYTLNVYREEEKVIEDDKSEVDESNDNNEESNKNILPITIGSILLIFVIVIIIILKNKNKK